MNDENHTTKRRETLRWYLHIRAITAVALLGVSVVLLLGMGSAPLLHDNRYDVASVSLNGPGTIRNGSSQDYTVTANIRRTGASENETIRATGGRAGAGRISLFSEDNQLTVRDIDTFPAGVNTFTRTLSLRCENNEVRGSIRGSGHGNPEARQWWCAFLCWVRDPAPIRARMNETFSPTINVLCRD